MLAAALAHRVLVKMELAGDSPDDRVQNAVARSRPVKDYPAALWPAVDPARLVLAAALGAGLPRRGGRGDARPPRSSGACSGPRPAKAPGSARWSLADAVLVDEAADLVERTPVGGHIVADEAQDLSADDAARRRRAARPTGSVTVLGDLAQATTPWAPAHLGRGAGPPRQARRARRGADPRLPGARRGDRVRRPAAPARSPRASTPPTSVRRARGDLTVWRPTVADAAGPRWAALAVARGLRGADRAGRPDRGRLAAALEPSRARHRGARRRARRTSRADRVRRPPRPGAGHPGQGPGVRPRGARSSRPASWPASPTGSPACAGSTSASPARSPR